MKGMVGGAMREKDGERGMLHSAVLNVNPEEDAWPCSAGTHGAPSSKGVHVAPRRGCMMGVRAYTPAAEPLTDRPRHMALCTAMRHLQTSVTMLHRMEVMARGGA